MDRLCLKDALRARDTKLLRSLKDALYGGFLAKISRMVRGSRLL